MSLGVGFESLVRFVLETLVMPQITVERITATELLVRGPEAIRDWREANRFTVPGAEFTTSYKQHHWDGTWAPGKWCRLVGDTWEMLCSIGLLPRLRRDLSIPENSGGSLGADPQLVRPADDPLRHPADGPVGLRHAGDRGDGDRGELCRA